MPYVNHQQVNDGQLQGYSCFSNKCCIHIKTKTHERRIFHKHLLKVSGCLVIFSLKVNSVRRVATFQISRCLLGNVHQAFSPLSYVAAPQNGKAMGAGFRPRSTTCKPWEHHCWVSLKLSHHLSLRLWGGGEEIRRKKRFFSSLGGYISAIFCLRNPKPSIGCGGGMGSQSKGMVGGQQGWFHEHMISAVVQSSMFNRVSHVISGSMVIILKFLFILS